MSRALLPSLLVAALATSLAAIPSFAAPGPVRYEQAAPVPAWAFGIEWGAWTNFADPAYVFPSAGPPGRLIVRYRNVPVFEVSATRMWRPIAFRASLSRAEIDFGVIDTIAGGTPRLGTATCDQLRISALVPVWSLLRSDDRRPGRTQWVLGLFTGPVIGWTRLSNPEASVAGVQYAGVDRLSVESGLQAGWEMWIGGPLWFDGPLAHVLLYVDMAVVGFGKDLVEFQTTPASAFVSGGSRVAPATFKVGLALLRNLESGHP